MTKARENSDYTGLAAGIVAGDTAARAGRKNLIINGGFDVWQRGTSGTKAVNGWASGYIAVDRWHTYGADTTQTKSSSTVGTDLVNTLKISGSGTNKLCTHAIENGSRLISGKDVTLSFYIRATTATESLSLNARFGTSLAGDSGDLSIGTVTTTTSWVKHAISFNVTDPSVNTTRHAMLRIASSAEEDFEIAQVQLELGSVATDFEHRSYGEELALCQRYYTNMEYQKGGSVLGFTGDVTSGSSYHLSFSFPTQMRATPSLTWSSWVSVGFPANVTFQETGVNGSNYYATAIQSGASKYFLGGYIADAEL